jgi:hypothetical protein
MAPPPYCRNGPLPYCPVAMVPDREPAPPQPQIDHIGAERAPVVVVDGFHDDPDGLVEAAARSEFHLPSAHLYPGVRAPAPSAYVRGLVTGLTDPVKDVFGLGGFELAGCECDFSLVTTPPERLRVLQCVPHFDTTDLRQIAVLHYLSGPEFGGTAFYRHRTTGFESVDSTRHDAYMLALGADLKRVGAQGFEQRYIDGDTSLFEQIASVESVYNRIVIYRSASLHSGMIGPACRFDSDPRKGRLTLNAFLHFRPGMR